MNLSLNNPYRDRSAIYPIKYIDQPTSYIIRSVGQDNIKAGNLGICSINNYINATDDFKYGYIFFSLGFKI